MSTIQSRARQLYQDWREDVVNAYKAIEHRVKYGSPVLFAEADDLGLNPQVVWSQKMERIKRRRKALGLPYEEYVGQLKK